MSGIVGGLFAVAAGGDVAIVSAPDCEAKARENATEFAAAGRRVRFIVSKYAEPGHWYVVSDDYFRSDIGPWIAAMDDLARRDGE